jgi:hypothetical protein
MQRETPGRLLEGEDPRKIRIIQDTKLPSWGVIFLGERTYQNFLADVKRGRYDLDKLTESKSYE